MTVISSAAQRDFVVARNPEQGSTLRYLLRLPVGDADVWLKTSELWPHSLNLYCHPVHKVPPGLTILERVPIELCARRGNAIDLILRRPQRKRSQFVFASKGNRHWIFWKTTQSSRAARPGLRIPTVRLGKPITIFVDSRERYAYQFSSSVIIKKCPLAAGDYAALDGERVLAVVERKSLADLIRSLSDGSLMYIMAELSTLAAAAVAVEGAYSALARHAFTTPGFLPDLVARLQIRYPAVGLQFLENRRLAEDWTYRFLRSAYENGGGSPLPLSGMR